MPNPKQPGGLRVVVRKSSGALTIVGTVNGLRIRRRAQSDRPALAAEEAAVLEAQLLRTEWHGERRGSRSFSEAVLSYLEAAPRAPGDQDRLNRILQVLGEVTLADIDQETVTRLVRGMLRPGAKPGTILRGVITPLRAVMLYAARRGWCDRPYFEIPKRRDGRTNYLLPEEFERLLAAAAPHLKPLLIFLVSTGARLSEAIELDWKDVDLRGARVIFWRTKTGKRRDAFLPPRTIVALAGLGHREGPVFRWQTTPDRQGKVKAERLYADRERQYGGQIKRGWQGAIRRAELDPALTPHDLRHTWASWYYAVNRDLLGLKMAGGWSSVALVERYAHLLPVGQEAAIGRVLGVQQASGNRAIGTSAAPAATQKS
jgi:integrase